MDFDALHREFLIDLNGDGRPDAVARGPRVPDYGLGPMTPATQAGRPNAELRQGPPTTGERAVNALLDYGPMPAKLAVEATGVPSLVRGGANIGEGLAAGDGWKVAGGAGQAVIGMLPAGAAMRPAAPIVNALTGSVPRMAATGAFAGVPIGISEAQAASGAGVASALEGDPEIARLRREITRKEAERGAAQTQNIKGLSGENAQRSRDQAAGLIQKDIEKLNTQLAQAEERVRGDYLKNAPFRERYPGAAEALVYGGMGIAGGLPFLSTMKQRAADFALNRPSPGFWHGAAEYGKNALMGAFASFEGSGLPDQIDAASFDPGHPVRERARAALTDPDYYASRVPAALLSGIGMAALGTEAGRLLTPGPRRPRGRGGDTGDSTNPPPPPPPNNPPPPPPPNGPLSAQNNPSGKYPGPGSRGRDYIRDEYRAAVSDVGGTLNASKASKALQEYARAQGGNLPSTTKRINETNRAYNEFVSTRGRPPATKAEWDTYIFRNTGTLGLAGAAAATGGGAYNALMQDYADQIAPY